MKQKPFLKNDFARVSFAVIGIVLILGSSMTSVYLGMNDQQRKEKNTWTTDQQQVETVLTQARIDLAQIINAAGVNALQYIGSHPVIIPSDQFESAEQSNQYRLQQKISEVLTQYLLINYVESMCKQSDLKLTVDLSRIPNKQLSPDSIVITPVHMQLHRPLGIPFFGPEQSENVPVYYQINCEIPVSISSRNDEGTDEPLSLVLPVSTVITNRFSLLQDLVDSFNASLHGLGPFWRTITLLVNIYSMARGYRHYQTGRPENIVENAHLEIITNLVFLFQSALTFGGIDPQLLIEVVKETKSIFSGEKKTNLDVVNSLSSPEWSVPFSEFQGSYPLESSPHPDPKDQQIINISDIASSILYDQTSLLLYFSDTNNQEQQIRYDYDSTASLEDIVTHYLNEGWEFISSLKGDKIQNQTTLQNMQTVSERLYQASFYTKIHRKGPQTILIGNHSGFPIDNGSSPWTFKQAQLQSIQSKPMKGSITTGSSVFEEVYTIIWQRDHHWSNKTTQLIDNETVDIWNEHITTDTKYEENVTFSVIVKEYADMIHIPGEIKDVFYENSTCSDTNLVTTIPVYITEIYESNKHELFNLTDGYYINSDIVESVPSWVIPDAFDALLDVYDLVSTITVDEEINPMNYPNPNVLLSLACQDIITQFESQKTMFEQKNLYYADGKFHCTGSKTVYAIRTWYVDLIHQQLQDLYYMINQDVDSAISDALSNAGVSSKKNFDEAMDESFVSSLQRQVSIPFSVPMQLEKKETGPMSSWDEQLLLAIDHTPSYFSCFSLETYEGKEEYFLGIQNTCLLGPTGLPILPITPATPWIVTLNLWFIQIRGSIAEFIIRDHSGETVFHPLFFNEPQDFVRKNEVIRANDGTILGYNTRVSFAVDTVACSVVPSWGLMVGDKKGGLYEHDGLSIS